MSKPDIIRAWKDAEYRSSLSESQKAVLPDNPAGGIDLSDSDLSSVAGGTFTEAIYGCPTGDLIPCGSVWEICTCLGAFCPSSWGPWRPIAR